jgi:hypothetical protein
MPNTPPTQLEEMIQKEASNVFADVSSNNYSTLHYRALSVAMRRAYRAGAEYMAAQLIEERERYTESTFLSHRDKNNEGWNFARSEQFKRNEEALKGIGV